MAVNAPARNVLSTGDFIRMAVGNCNIQFGSFWAVIGNISARSTAGVTNLIGQHTSTGEGKGMLLWANGNKLGLYNGASELISAIPVEQGEGQLFLGATKATGTVKAKFYKLKYSTPAWTAEEPAGTLANATAIPGGTIRFNEWQNTEFSTMNLIAAGMSASVLTEAEMRAIAEARYWGLAKTLSSPKGVWLFNQNTTGIEIPDITGGGADQSAISGTTVSAASLTAPYWVGPPFALRTARNILLRR